MSYTRLPLSEVALINPRVPKEVRELPKGLATFVSMAAVSEEGTVDLTAERPVADVIKGFTYFENNDVLVAKITPCMENGKACHIQEMPQCIGFGSTEFHVLRPKKGVIDGRYLFHCVWNSGFRSIAENNMTGSAGQKRVPTHFFDRFSVLIPPLAEQKRIAAILDKADTLRQKRKQAIELTETFLRSVFLEMFGDPVSNPKRWETKTFGEIGDVITGNTPSRKHTEYYGDTIEWIKSNNINTPRYYLTEAEEGLSEEGIKVARIAPKNSVLVSCIAGSLSCIGNAAIADREVAFNQQINAFVPAETNAEFIFTMLLVNKALIQNASTKSMKGMVSKGSFQKIKAICPPKTLQDRFRLIFLRLQTFRHQHHVGLSHAENLFQSLSTNLFTGRQSTNKKLADFQEEPHVLQL